jgi:hypothetical protein
MIPPPIGMYCIINYNYQGINVNKSYRQSVLIPNEYMLWIIVHRLYGLHKIEITAIIGNLLL